MRGKMKAQVFYEPEVMRLETVDIPEIGPDEVLVRVRACGICGSDISYYYGHSPLDTPSGIGPLILGHEFAGDVAQVGAIAKEMGLFREGDRVLANPVQNCNACPTCAKKLVHLCDHARVSGVSVNGAFAEYACVRYTHLHQIPSGVSYEKAALCEPLACACHGISQLDVALGDACAIFGPGTIGLMMLSLIKARGAGPVAMIGAIDYTLNKARALGADHVINTVDASSPYYAGDLVGEVTQKLGQLADRVIVPTAAQPALEGALEVSGRGSTIVYFGLPGPETILPVRLLDTLKMEKTIKVSWLAPFAWDMALKALRDGVVKDDALITHRFTLDALEAGIKAMNDRTITNKTKGMVYID